MFTYGPLGFLEQPSVIDGLLATLGGVWVLAIRTALAATYLRAARRSVPWPAAALLALAGMALVPPEVGSVPLALAAVWSLVALQDPDSHGAQRLALWGGGALAGIEVLVKLNIGVTVLVIVGVAAVAAPGRRARNAATLLGVFVATAAVGWFASGQGVSNLTDYVRSSYEVLSGYSEAMQTEVGKVAWDGWAALALAIATVGATAYASLGLATVRRIGMLAVVGVLLFSLEKYSFVRHDAGHIGAFFGVLPAVWLALRWREAARFAAIAALAVIAVVYFPVTGQTFDDTFSPRLGVDQVSTLVAPGKRADARDEARAQLQAQYAVNPLILAAIGSQPVDARPFEIGIVWAYGLNWDPLPVLQDYQAYTPWLDRLNADALADDDGHRFVLRHLTFDDTSTTGIDGRYAPYDSPAMTQVLLCNFEPLGTTDTHQLLERVPDRCGPERPLETVEATYGERVPVPTANPGEAVFVRVDGAAATGVETLRALLYKAAVRHLDLGAHARARLQARNAADGLLIFAPPKADFGDPFRLAPDVDSIRITSEGGFATSEGELTFDFYAVPVAPLANSSTGGG